MTTSHSRSEQGARILLVEDNPADVRLFRLACDESFSSVDLEIATDGEIALHRLRIAPPQLLILDLNLPKIGGFEVLDRMKAYDDLRKIKVVIFSSSRSEQDVRRAYLTGAACFIQKPTDYTDMERICASLGQIWLRVATLPS